MIKLINANSGGEMWVHESRLDEYLAAGHKLAAPPMPEPPKRPKVSESGTAKKTTKRK